MIVYFAVLSALVLLALGRAYLERKPRARRVFKSLGVVEITIISILLGTLIFFGCLQIVLRNLYHSGIIWADPLMRHVVLWLGCLGGALATARVRHINIDILSRFLPERLAGMRDRVVFFATGIVSSILGLAAARLVIDEKAFDEKAFLGIDTWVLQLILPIAFFMISYRSFVNTLLRPRPKPVEWEYEDPGRPNDAS